MRWVPILLLNWGFAAIGIAQAQVPQGVPILMPWETVQLEHNDRVRRLARLAKEYGSTLVAYEEYIVSQAEHGLVEFPTDIPVLRVVFNQRVFFDFDESRIRPEGSAVINVIADSLRSEPDDVVVFIAGHTDSIGDDAYNYNLGLERAQSVAITLARQGVYQAEIYRISFGEAVPIAPNDSDAGRARNRRVEFLFGARPEALAVWMEAQSVDICAARDAQGINGCRRTVRFEAASVEINLDVNTTSQSIGSARQSADPNPGRATGNVGSTGGSVNIAADRPRISNNNQIDTVTIEDSNEVVSIGRHRIEVDLSREREVVRVVY